MSSDDQKNAKNMGLAAANLVLSLVASLGYLLLYLDIDDDTLNIKALFIGIALFAAVVHMLHGALLLLLPAFMALTGPRQQADLEVVVRNKMSQVLLISSAVVMGMDITKGTYGELNIDAGNLTPLIVLVLVSAVLRLIDMFDDLETFGQSLEVICDLREEEDKRKNSAVARMVIANILYAISAAFLITQFAEEEGDGKGGNRSQLSKDIQISAFSLVLFHALLKLVVYGLGKVDSIKNLLLKCIKDECTADQVEVAALNQLPLVRLIVATVVIVLMGLQLGETWGDSRDVNFIVGGLLAYAVGEDIGRNLL